MSHPYDVVIGLEIHVQLQTESKMFSWCGTEFGLPPNTQTDPVSLGMPGTLPVMNRKAFELALKTAVALGAKITPFTKWDRKNYYYPDLPKNYQISQYDLPFSTGGSLDIPARKDGGGGGVCTLTRVHLEEDTGKLTHGVGEYSEVDLNRAGIPLLEIVSEPEIRSAADARGCLEELRLTLRYLGVSDCEMQEGSLRCDANVNLHIHKDGKTIATPIVEIKNLNSFRAVEKAINYEATRQYEKWEKDGLTIKDAPKGTWGWDDELERTKPQREKETAADYRYFPEPDLVPVVVDDAWLGRIRESIGELPHARRERFEAEYNLSFSRCGFVTSSTSFHPRVVLGASLIVRPSSFHFSYWRSTSKRRAFSTARKLFRFLISTIGVAIVLPSRWMCRLTLASHRSEPSCISQSETPR